MKKILIALLLFALVIIPAAAQDCRVSGKFEDIIDSLNMISDFLSDVDETYYGHINPDKCEFEIQDNKGLYICQINASTGLYIGTDKYLKADTLQIQGYTETNKPRKTSYDWAYIATVLACGQLQMEEITNIFIQAYKNNYYLTEDFAIVSNMHPEAENLWVFSLFNR